MSLLSSTLYLAIGAALAVGASSVGGSRAAPAAANFPAPQPAAASALPPTRAPADLAVTHPRPCAAVVVYNLATADDWGLRTTIAAATLKGFRDAGQVPDCSAAVAKALSHDFSQYRWQAALDAVDAVMEGSYSVSPDACARANTIIPLTIVPDSPPDAVPPTAALAQCVIYDLAFVEVRP